MAIIKVGQLTPEQLEQFSVALQQRGADQACPRCRYKIFTILDQFTYIPVGGGGLGIQPFGGVPTITCFCNRCGFVSTHLVAVLTGANPDV